MRKALCGARSVAGVALCLATLVLAGCATQKAPVVTEDPRTCAAAPAGEPLIGNWLSVRKQSGVAGELHTLFTLNADGTMGYVVQLKRSRKPAQGLSESGCWSREGSELVLRTLQSNGEHVDPSDPIYVNRYSVVSSNDKALVMQHQGVRTQARRMPPDYKLTW